MAGSKSGGSTLSFQRESYLNFQKQMEKLEKLGPEKGYKMLVQVLFDIKVLAQQKLKSDKHILYSRLRNSIYVKTPGQKHANRSGNSSTYSDNEGKTYDSDFYVTLTNLEGAVGTNVEYGPAIEFGYPPHTIEAKEGKFLSWIPKAAGEAWFEFKNKSSLRKYYKDRKGKFTLKKQDRVYAKKVQHPGFAGDSFLTWALRHVDVEKRGRETAKEILDGVR